MHKIKWDYRNQKIAPDEINKFSEQFKFGYVFSTVLLSRGIKTEEQLKKYFSKSLEFVHNPIMLPDIEIASNRIASAIENKEKIVIYGDYDVDGVTSVSLLYSFLKSQNADVSFYIPDRMGEGYGLNIKAINKLSKLGTKLLITVDCGIASVGEVELAKAQKMDVIITDHHTCKEKIPNALAVINPKRPDSEYPFKELAGVGVVFKTVLAIAKHLKLNTTECFLKFAPFAAIGTVADVVELQDENRIIVDRGLKNLKNSCHGINALLKVSGIDEHPIDSNTIAFSLSPRINAAGRMENAQIAADLLLSDDGDEAIELAEKLDELNRKRQQIERAIYDEAVKMIADENNFEDKRIIVLAKENWHHGIIGIVASKITEQFYKPCILLSACEDNKLKGSGRSVEGINLFDALSDTEDLLTQFGGHSLAAGLSLNKSEFPEFCKRIDEYIKKTYPEVPTKTLSIDCSVPQSFVTLENAKQLLHFEPFGFGNEKPIFAMSNVKVISASAIGQDNRHLRLLIDIGGKKVNAIGFSLGHLASYLTQGLMVDIAFNLEVNSWLGEENVQLLLKDIKKS